MPRSTVWAYPVRVCEGAAGCGRLLLLLPPNSGVLVYLRKVLPAVCVAVALVVLGACGDDDDGVAIDSALTPPQQSAGASATPSPTTGSEHNDADVRFAQEMIVHHQGALAMAKLGEQQARTTEVRALAKRIRAAQEPEVQTLSSWLNEWDEQVPGATSSTPTATATATARSTSTPMDHDGMAASPEESERASGAGETGSGMSGMDMSEMDLSELESAGGVEFDRMFLTMMIEHHRDAIAMAKTEQAEGLYPEAIALAKEIESAQQAEIAEMEEMLAEL